MTRMAVLLLCALVGACSSPASLETDSPFPIRVEQQRIKKVGNWIEMRVTYHNSQDQPRYLGQCYNEVTHHLEKLVEEEWIKASNYYCAGVSPTPFTKVMPGEEIEVLLQVSGFILDDIPGTHRLVFHIYEDSSIHSPRVPLEECISNSFEIEE